MKPSQVLEEQVDLLKWWRSPMGMEYASGFVDKESEKEHSMIDQGWDGHHLVANESHHLDRAPTYWVSKAMTELVEQAAKKMNAESLYETSLPSRSGFIWFDKLVHSYDVNLQAVNVRAVMWAPVTMRIQGTSNEVSGVILSLYSDTREFGEDELLRKLRDEKPDYIRNMPRLLLLHMRPWVFGEDFMVDEKAARLTATELLGEDPPEEWVSQMAYMTRFMFSFWKLVQMPIAVHEKHHPDRASSRRMARGGITLPNEEINVVLLRKTRPKAKNNDDGEGDQDAIEWSHRWLVDGFWRWQWYPTRERHEQIWISPYIKGPEDRPLIIKDKVYAWKR